MSVPKFISIGFYWLEGYSNDMARRVKAESASRRTYVSKRRSEQAGATRWAIVQAALRLFAANGFSATTMQAVADEAGVAFQTVYAIFGNKRELLRQTLEAAIVDDPEADAVAERDEAKAIAKEPNARRRAELAAAMVTQNSSRIVPIVRVAREAAAVDPEFAATAASITAGRRQDMVASARLLAGPGTLRVPVEEAVGTLYTLYSPDTYTALTVDMGWSPAQFERWLADALERLLFP